MRVGTAVILAAAACTGCTHRQLDRSTLRQAGTVTDIQYRQVLNNLAAFHCNPDVLPHFAVVGTGGTAVTDQASANVELEWDARTITRELLGLGASREVQEQWTLAPVVNPDKLRAIRSLFQLVVRGETTDRESDKLLKAFLGESYMEWVRRGWYGVGGCRDVPKGACLVAHCGHTYVWVMPDGFESLSRLTLVVLNVATLDPTAPPEQPTKTVKKWVSCKETECVPVCKTKWEKECVPVCKMVTTYRCETRTWSSRSDTPHACRQDELQRALTGRLCSIHFGVATKCGVMPRGRALSSTAERALGVVMRSTAKDWEACSAQPQPNQCSPLPCGSQA